MNKRIKAYFAAMLFSSVIVCGSFVEANASITVPRIAGVERGLTAIEISKAGWTTSENVVLATGEDFPDALCAAPLAKQLNAPILLTEGSALTSSLEAELNRLGAQNVYIIGGEGVIPKTIMDKLESNGFNCVRISGGNREETSVKVAEYITANFEVGKDVVVATGEDFPDALSIAPVAAVKGMPILLASKSELLDVVKKYIQENGVTKVYVVGGTGVVDDTVEAQLPNPERVYGDDRYKTNKAVFDRFTGDLNFGTTYLATGENYPDALAGSALAPKTLSPIILTAGVPEQPTIDSINSKFLYINQIMVLGGEGVVSPAAYQALVPTIESVNNIESTVNAGQNFTLPKTVNAAFSNGTVKQSPVTWNSEAVDTTAPGIYTFEGTVDGYAGKVVLTLTVNEVPQVIKHSLMGEPEVTAEQMAKFLLKTEPNPKISVTALELAQMFLDEGRREGIRGDLAFCQSIHETGWFQYGGGAMWEWNNYAGIGVTGAKFIDGVVVEEPFIDGVTVLKNINGGWVGVRFDTPELGVRAQIQHLKAYATKLPLSQPLVDPRYSILVQYGKWGIAPTLEDLAGNWAVPGYKNYSSLEEAMLNNDSYGQNIYKIFEDLKAVQIP